MKIVSYAAWCVEFDKLVKAYLLDIDWKTIYFEENDFGEIGDDLQWDAYRNIYFNIVDESDIAYDHNPDVAEWVHYDQSCDNRTDFEIDLKNDWDYLVETRNDDN